MSNKSDENNELKISLKIFDEYSTVPISMVAASFFVSLLIALAFAQNRPTGLRFAENRSEKCVESALAEEKAVQ